VTNLARAAVRDFTAATLRRSALHQGVVVGLSACGVALAVNSLLRNSAFTWLRGDAAPRWGIRADQLHTAEQMLCSVHGAIGGALEMGALRQPSLAPGVVIVAVLSAVAFAVRRWRRAKWRDFPLVFDDELSTDVQVFRLSPLRAYTFAQICLARIETY